MENEKNTTKYCHSSVGAPFAGIHRRTDTTVPYKIKNIQGITLIALVVIIIILLILAGVVLNLTLGEHGIIKQAEQAGEQYKISEILEKLELEKVDLYARKNGEVPSLQEYINHLINKGIITSADVTDIDDNNKNIVVEGHLFFVEKEASGNIKITYQGKPDNTPRIVGLQVTGTTIDSISVKVVASNADGASYKYSIKNITLGETEFTEVTTLNTNEYTFTGLTINNEYIIQVELITEEVVDTKETEAIKLEAPPPPPPTAGVGADVHEAHEIQYTWEELNELAKVISNNYGEEEGQINNDTAEVNVSINGKADTLGIGDWTTVNGYQVRILGFNHDVLTNTDAYGEGGTNIYAGISFGAIDTFGEKSQMNSINTNEGGWGVCERKKKLNEETVQTLENNKHIKEVSKYYIETNDDANSVMISQDKLWLLSCSEIWEDGYQSGYGYAIGKEGNRYKWFKIINASWNIKNDNLKLTHARFLRSLYYSSNYFCCITADGTCNKFNASPIHDGYVGFCI